MFLDGFTSFQKAIDSNFETINSEIYLVKTQGKFTDKSG